MTLKDFLNNGDRMAAENGIQITSIKQGVAITTMTVEKRHLNAGGVCQGGALFTLADFAQAAVCNASGNLSFAINCNITFHNGAKLGDRLTATATLAASHPKLPYCIIRIENQDGLLIATATGTSYAKRVPLEGIDALE